MKCRKIQKGSCFGIMCPSSRCTSPKTVERFLNYLNSLGFKYKVGKTVTASFGYLAGTDELKAEDFNNFMKDDEVDAILCFKGGYGSIRFLDLIDYEQIKKTPKLVVGFSDVTALINVIYQKTNVPMLHGEMGIRFKEAFVEEQDFSFKNLIATLLGTAPKNLLEEVNNLNLEKKLEFKAGLNNPVEGIIVGGNLSLVASMMGTPYEIDTKDKILLLEDVSEEPYSIDRYLATLKISGKLNDAKAIILGYFTNCNKADPNDDTQTYMDVLYEYTKDLTCPVIYNFPTGHDRPFVNVPIGLKAKVDIKEESVIVLEDLFFDK